ncbi:LysR family transcriptional regulator [Pseudoalteromonas maricaloris]|uniref:LysR family transcriptional regulator n=1 Tax=Pseudoalteromonas maricaloris TaxID=184924 RepID=UPI0021AD5E41|nr:LysR family transcriptional regulator [Pseudoalteromonas flavipulchra]USE71060.1 LysR family transcriptional regulator [Pseudoalteromonas flavipulchra]
MDWLTGVRSFSKVVEFGSFTRAADEEGVSASAVSKRIDWLEQQLGLTLFIRTTRQVNLTEAGEHFLPKASLWLAQFECLTDHGQALNQAPSGSLKIASTLAVGSTILMPNIASFLAKYPKLKIHLNVIAPGAHPDLTHDLVITRYYEAFDSASHKGSRLIDYQMQIFGAPHYLKQHEPIKSLNDLRQHKMLLSSYYHKLGGIILEIGDVFQFDNYNFVSDQLDAMLTAAVQGLGLVFIAPSYVKRELDQGLLIPVLPEIKSETKQLWAYYPKTNYTPYKTQLFIEHLKNHLNSME